jgi:hypothetical protein
VVRQLGNLTGRRGFGPARLIGQWGFGPAAFSLKENIMKVRILSAVPVAGVLLPVDCVPDLDPTVAENLVASGAADAHPDAVAYAEGIGIAVPELPPENVLQPAPEPAEAPPAASPDAPAQPAATGVARRAGK